MIRNRGGQLVDEFLGPALRRAGEHRVHVAGQANEFLRVVQAVFRVEQRVIVPACPGLDRVGELTGHQQFRLRHVSAPCHSCPRLTDLLDQAARPRHASE